MSIPAPISHTAEDGYVYKLRGIRARDIVALAETLRDWPEMDGKYTSDHAKRDASRWETENEVWPGLPAPDLSPLTWALVYNGPPVVEDDEWVPGARAIGFCRIVYLLTQSHIHFQAIHPDYRGAGHFTVMNLMLRTLISPMGVTRVTFESLPTSPQVTAHAEARLELTPTETKTGLTGQEVTSYEFTADYQAERLKGAAADEVIAVQASSTR